MKQFTLRLDARQQRPVVALKNCLFMIEWL